MRRIFVVLFLLASFIASASEAKDLEKTTRLWQTRLHMKEWSITVKPVPLIVLEMFTDKQVFAMSTWDVKSRTGVIFVLMRSDYTPEIKKSEKVKNVKADQRDSVVHELLHNVVANMNEESAVRVITTILNP